MKNYHRYYEISPRPIVEEIGARVTGTSPKPRRFPVVFGLRPISSQIGVRNFPEKPRFHGQRVSIFPGCHLKRDLDLPRKVERCAKWAPAAAALERRNDLDLPRNTAFSRSPVLHLPRCYTVWIGAPERVRLFPPLL